MPERIPGVAEQDPHVFDAALVQPGEEVADPGRMDLDPDVVPVRPVDRRVEKEISPPESDLDHQGCPAAEFRGGIDGWAVSRGHPRRGGRPEAEAWPVTVDGPLLTRRHAARPQHPGTDVGPHPFTGSRREDARMPWRRSAGTRGS